MNKKGFTLVELLSVLIIMGIIMTLAVPSVFKISKNMKVRYFCEKINDIEKAALQYAQDNYNDQVQEGEKETIIKDAVSLYKLIDGNYLNKDNESCDINKFDSTSDCIKDPRDNRSMDRDKFQIYTKNKRIYVRYLYNPDDANDKVCGKDVVYNLNKYNPDGSLITGDIGFDVNAIVDGSYEYSNLPFTFDLYFDDELVAGTQTDYHRENIPYGTKYRITNIKGINRDGTKYECDEKASSNGNPLRGFVTSSTSIYVVCKSAGAATETPDNGNTGGTGGSTSGGTTTNPDTGGSSGSDSGNTGSGSNTVSGSSSGSGSGSTTTPGSGTTTTPSSPTNTLIEKITSVYIKDSSDFATDDPDNNIRYIGANPNNYVLFNCSNYANQTAANCEKWRIIGIFKNITKSDGTKEDLVKIIRDDTIGGYSYDSSESYQNSGLGYNDWSSADLMKLLNKGYSSLSTNNSLYYNASKGNCYNNANNATTSCDFTTTGLKNAATRNAFETVVWSIGGMPYNIANKATAKNWYQYERADSSYSGNQTIWKGQIALMYPSDFGYSTKGSSTILRSVCLENEYAWSSDNYKDCRLNSYLFKSRYNQSSLGISSSWNNYFYGIGFGGAVGLGMAKNADSVRPTGYLRSDIKVNTTTGDGSSTNPYRLNLS